MICIFIKWCLNQVAAEQNLIAKLPNVITKKCIGVFKEGNLRDNLPNFRAESPVAGADWRLEEGWGCLKICLARHLLRLVRFPHLF
jgi:hypothetical protein